MKELPKAQTPEQIEALLPFNLEGVTRLPHPIKPPALCRYSHYH
ncbi:MAG: hypothetical protein GY807_02680 [Gammaproteobacteria bacterium]|nr:hypothetical protein [Gammaproteobacteria bacterium]